MESTLRARAVEPGLRLIETMLWDGAGVPRLPLHLARMARGAAALGWDMPEGRIAGLLGGVAGGPWRLRLTLGAGGDVALEAGAVPAPIACWRLGLAGVRLTSADPWLVWADPMRATALSGDCYCLSWQPQGVACRVSQQASPKNAEARDPRQPWPPERGPRYWNLWGRPGPSGGRPTEDWG